MKDPRTTRTPSDPRGDPLIPSGWNAGARDIALCRSILYEALALGFRPPTPETRDRLVSPEGAEALAAAARVIDGREGGALEARARKLAGAGAAAEDLPEVYVRLFGHSVRGTVSPYETEYGHGTLFQQPQELADLSGFLRAFGLTQRREAHERIDHVSCECEFMLFLARKEAHAVECGNREMQGTTEKAARAFLKDHLGRFGATFAHRLIREDRHGFYGALGDLLHGFLESECHRFRVKMGIEGLPLRRPAGDPLPAACGTAEDLLEIQRRPTENPK